MAFIRKSSKRGMTVKKWYPIGSTKFAAHSKVCVFFFQAILRDSTRDMNFAHVRLVLLILFQFCSPLLGKKWEILEGWRERGTFMCGTGIFFTFQFFLPFDTCGGNIRMEFLEVASACERQCGWQCVSICEGLIENLFFFLFSLTLNWIKIWTS